MYPLSFLQNAPFGKEVCNHINCKFQLNVHIPLLNLCQTNIPKSTQFLQRNDFAAKSFHLQSIQLTQPRPHGKKINMDDKTLSLFKRNQKYVFVEKINLCEILKMKYKHGCNQFSIKMERCIYKLGGRSATGDQRAAYHARIRDYKWL